VSGVEVSQAAARHAEALGFRVFRGELPQAKYPAGCFDVVTASEVLEHVAEPRPLVAEIARILRPGGLLWATTPHANGISSKALGLKWSVLNSPEHLQLFSFVGIEVLLGEAGFRRVRVAAHGLNPLELLQALSKGASSGQGVPASVRVQSGYRLNAFMSRSRPRQALRQLINGMLNISRLGDSLKIWAVR
jgi:SAM-dependent methyltransferase